MTDDLRSFSDFVNSQLDLSGLVASTDAAPLKAPRLTDAEIEQVVMPLIRDDIQRETLRLVVQLLRSPQDEHWKAQLAPFHREVRQCLAPAVAGMMEHRYPGRLSVDEWLDVATFTVTLAWLVRKQMDEDDLPLSADP